MRQAESALVRVDHATPSQQTGQSDVPSGSTLIVISRLIPTAGKAPSISSTTQMLFRGTVFAAAAAADVDGT
jgi:hypothetical protein